MADITELLNKWQAGDRGAFDDLVPRVYGEMRAIAAHLLCGQRPGHVLETSALVHEPWDLARQIAIEPDRDVLGVSAQAVSRDWTVARAWRSRRLGDASNAAAPSGPSR